MQHFVGEIKGAMETRSLPHEMDEVWPGLLWGRFEQPLTPAFWACQAWMSEPDGDENYRLGRTLKEEIIFCLLGGHGAPAEVGLAASARICEAYQRADNQQLPQSELERLLREPLTVKGRSVRYRFAAQRARYLAGTFERFDEADLEALGDIELRDALCEMPGIGPKTASWIVRNRRGSDQVAILDVHIVRACSAIGVFPTDANPSRNYSQLEERFVSFCTATESRASAMDAVMWSTMRSLSQDLLQQLIDQAGRVAQRCSSDKFEGDQQCLVQVAPEAMVRVAVAAS